MASDSPQENLRGFSQPPAAAHEPGAEQDGQIALDWVKNFFGERLVERVQRRLENKSRPTADEVCWALHDAQAEMAKADVEALDRFSKIPCTSRIRRRTV
jgi:hypothetical protein